MVQPQAFLLSGLVPSTSNRSPGQAALGAGARIVIRLHRIDGAAAALVVSRVRSEDRAQQNAGLTSLGMPLATARRAGMVRGMAFQFSFMRFFPRAVELIGDPPRAGRSSPGEMTNKDYNHGEWVSATRKINALSLNRARSLS